MNTDHSKPAKPWPTELRVREGGTVLAVMFDDGARFTLPAEILRVRSPSAEVQGHSEAERKLVAGKRHVAILEVQPIGNYAVRLGFDDLHATGIYSWEWIYDCGCNLARYQAEYEAALAAAGLSRDPPPRR
ncbi:gamma-butyrobetaine hydroxylase-like domain-containing protein [Rhodoplanes serenus]|uniref:gamma-butyrobetaine hydroxylase-like domain-containing protein n=1 Tax=Rhodoplanes serenus TaxID=200615 RepID=UPI000DADC718|nr:gamma-butyrobetaine hydroxylase-like domain-containing protein [Rhodoplanes serenus]RAI34617.1 hypothetical protein CH340_08560 [Rhodoplanes serenus]